MLQKHGADIPREWHLPKPKLAGGKPFAEALRLRRTVREIAARKLDQQLLDASRHELVLFAASQGLACWFHNCDRVALAKSLKLRGTQRVLFAQTVGYPIAPSTAVAE